MHLKSGCVSMLLLVFVPPVLIGAVSVVLDETGHRREAWLLSHPGVLIWMLLVALYLAIWNSRKHWPELRWFQRLARILTFGR